MFREVVTVTHLPIVRIETIFLSSRAKYATNYNTQALRLHLNWSFSGLSHPPFRYFCFVLFSRSFMFHFPVALIFFSAELLYISTQSMPLNYATKNMNRSIVNVIVWLTDAFKTVFLVQLNF